MQTASPPRSATTRLIAGVVCAVVVGAVFVLYLRISTSAGQGEVVLPLDDVYIHFQYARQIASGQPYVYNPGDAPTSGGTSFLYPWVLGLGYTIGFQGLTLGLWAQIIGALALLISTWLVIRSAQYFGLPFWLAVAGGLTMPLSGPFAWHAMSGMETSLIILFTVATLYAFVIWHFRMLAIFAALLALTRPEGTIMALIAAAVIVLRIWLTALAGRQHHLTLPRLWVLWLLLIIAACLLQPLVNLMVTGSLSATGGQAKSILSTVPFYPDEVLRRILQNLSRMWVQFFTGSNWNAPGDFMPALLGPLAAVGLLTAFIRPQHRFSGLLLLGWLTAVSAAVATLDTAFWHFKRYQMPLFALLTVLALWGTWGLWQVVSLRNRAAANMTLVLLIMALLLTTTPTAARFLRLYQVNVANVMAQPLPMARWLAVNTSSDAVVAVHDVGMMRYIGQRYTIDMVGLTTAGAADAWRSGPGAIAAFLHEHQPPPDYVAAYITARGLNYLADTSIYGELLVAFSAEYAPEDNVALGADFQGIYRTSWGTAARASAPQQRSVLHYLDDLQPVDWLNIADLQAEEARAYLWSDAVRTAGFATEVYEQTYIDCVPLFTGGTCPAVLDTGRRINGEESFTLQSQPGRDAVLVTRVQPQSAGSIDIYVNETLIARRWIPAIPGRWLEIPTRIPAAFITGETIRIRIMPNIPGGHYRPYHHWLYQGDYRYPDTIAGDIYFQNGAIGLQISTAPVEDRLAHITLNWSTDGSAYGDFKVFVHLYDDPNQPPIAQIDTYPAGGTLPPGNWLPGMFSETLVVDLEEIPSGIYRMALGLYEAESYERLLPQAEHFPVDEVGRRVFVGEIEVP